jgi:hypothetical protein
MKITKGITMNQMQNLGRTIYLKVDKDTPLINIIGNSGVYKSDRFRTIAEDEEAYLIEILPNVKYLSFNVYK